MRRSFPILVCFGFGTIMLAQFFIPSKLSTGAYNEITNWVQIIYAFALIVGVVGLIRYHLSRVSRRQGGWFFNLVTVSSLFMMAFLGFVWGRGDHSPFMWVFNNMMAPMQATVFSLLAFFVASAAYRGFVARNIEAFLLLFSAVMIMFGIASIGNSIPPFSDIANWILMNPSMTARRGIFIGVGLGTIAVSLRVILGVERTYLGKE
ncbi:MAG: hypothetical protein JSW64_04090 [Candidatus Zixiibacteriota bacterium]|nr:MAG: hypothetical protein JSW64_04090 [candidate division Zixibacteria bacterium]